MRRAELGVGATQVFVAFLLFRERGTARRTRHGHRELPFLAGARGHHGPHNLGNHVTGFAEHHGVPNEHALAFDLMCVVKGRKGDGGPGDGHWRHHAVGSHAPRAPHIHTDVFKHRVHFFRRKLVRNGPARRTARGSQFFLHSAVIYLEHHAIDLVDERVPASLKRGQVLLHSADASHHFRFTAHR